MPARTPDLDEELQRFEERLPDAAARALNWLRRPSSRWVRIPTGGLLIVAGVFGFLPLLGFWMVPLGLVLLAQEIPFLRRGAARLLAWINRRWPAHTPRTSRGADRQ
jgi:hypothetical protein